MVHNYYDAKAVIHFDFNPLTVTRGNKFKVVAMSNSVSLVTLFDIAICTLNFKRYFVH